MTKCTLALLLLVTTVSAQGPVAVPEERTIPLTVTIQLTPSEVAALKIIVNDINRQLDVVTQKTPPPISLETYLGRVVVGQLPAIAAESRQLVANRKNPLLTDAVAIDDDLLAAAIKTAKAAQAERDKIVPPAGRGVKP